MSEMLMALQEKVDLLLVITKSLWTTSADRDRADRLDRSVCPVRSSTPPPALSPRCLAVQYHCPVGFLTDIFKLSEKEVNNTGQKLKLWSHKYLRSLGADCL